MKLLTKEILDKIPPLYSNEDAPDPIVWAKFFTPDSGWTWLATEYSPEERLFFGFVVSGMDPAFSELGYFSLDELESVTGPLGLHIERDMYWTPVPLSVAKEKEMGKSATRKKMQRLVIKQGAYVSPEDLAYLDKHFNFEEQVMNEQQELFNKLKEINEKKESKEITDEQYNEQAGPILDEVDKSIAKAQQEADEWMKWNEEKKSKQASKKTAGEYNVVLTPEEADILENVMGLASMEDAEDKEREQELVKIDSTYNVIINQLKQEGDSETVVFEFSGAEIDTITNELGMSSMEDWEEEGYAKKIEVIQNKIEQQTSNKQASKKIAVEGQNYQAFIDAYADSYWDLVQESAGNVYNKNEAEIILDREAKKWGVEEWEIEALLSAFREDVILAEEGDEYEEAQHEDSPSLEDDPQYIHQEIWKGEREAKVEAIEVGLGDVCCGTCGEIVTLSIDVPMEGTMSFDEENGWYVCPKCNGSDFCYTEDYGGSRGN